MTHNEKYQKISEVFQDLDKQILLCDSPEDLLLFACAMMTLSKNIFDQELGIEGRKKMFKDYV